MKKFCYSIVLMIMCCVFVLAGCSSPKGLSDNPATNAPISGNGGYAVVKGDYLYYTNGYLEDYTSVYDSTKDNKFGDVKFGAIYRTKLSNGNLQKDADGFLTKTEVVVPKLVGYENGGFYIFGDYIYYATPHMEEEKGGQLRNDLTSFCRIKIDGTNNTEKLYVSSSAVSNDDWKFYQVGNNVYLVIAESTNDGTKLVSVKINTKGKATTKTLATKVSDYVLYEGSASDNYSQYVYYTKTITGTGNALSKVNFVNGDVDDFEPDGGTYSLEKLIDNKLFYSVVRPITGTNKTTTYFCSRRIDGDFEATNELEIAAGTYGQHIVAGYNSNVVAVLNGDSVLKVYVDNVANKNVITEVDSFLGFIGDDLYYKTNSGSYMKVKVTADPNAQYTPVKAYDTEKSILDKVFDCDGNRLYVFASYTGENDTDNYYMNAVYENEPTFVGSFAKGHTPERPEDDGEIWIA